jgi:acyl-CoA thioester hydrolase
MSESVRAAWEGTVVYSGTVLNEWIDINQHMNVAYYVLAFDLGVDSLWTHFGITDERINDQASSTFAVECHVTWQREMLADAPFVITSQVLAFDAKRIHQFMRMYSAAEGYLAATAEWMNLHVDLDTRRVAPWPDDVLARIDAFSAAQADMPMPEEAGRRMRVKEPARAAAGYP